MSVGPARDLDGVTRISLRGGTTGMVFSHSTVLYSCAGAFCAFNLTSRDCPSRLGPTSLVARPRLGSLPGVSVAERTVTILILSLAWVRFYLKETDFTSPYGRTLLYLNTSNRRSEPVVFSNVDYTC
jgi:hypothetical protein